MQMGVEVGEDRLIARSFSDEPVVVRCATLGERVSEIFRVDPRYSIGFHNDMLFPYRSDTYEELALAFRAGETERLLNLWTRATPIRGRRITFGQK